MYIVTLILLQNEITIIIVNYIREKLSNKIVSESKWYYGNKTHIDTSMKIKFNLFILIFLFTIDTVDIYEVLNSFDFCFCKIFYCPKTKSILMHQDNL